MLISKFDNSSTNERIKYFEEKYNLRFPTEYKVFLSKYNGGYTPDTKFKVGKISSDLRAFYGLGNVKYSIEELNIGEWIENLMLPIACDSFGNYINIGISDYNAGKIFFQEHELGGRNSLLCDDLNEFLESCKSELISDDYRMSIEEREAELIARGKGANISAGLRNMWQIEIDKYANIVQEEVIIN